MATHMRTLPTSLLYCINYTHLRNILLNEFTSKIINQLHIYFSSYTFIYHTS